MRGYRLVSLQFREDLRGQMLPEFDPPLVEADDIPDHPLDEDLVFVQGDRK